MIDVAQLAGVSHQTVSRVLNESNLVGPELRERVTNAIQLLGYKRNTAARALATNRTMNLGVVCFGISQYGPSLALIGMSESARQAGYATSLVSLPEINRDSVREALEHLVDIAVDGIAVIAPVKGATDAVMGFSANIPLIAFEPGAEHGSSSVAIDEVLGARLATQHLLELGHETVWHVGGPDGWLATDARMRGWRAELAARGRVAHEVLMGDWSSASGYRAGKFIAERRDITAVYVANDQMSLGLLQALSQAGLEVPRDVSVVGFDDIPESPYFQPALTTVRLDFRAIGHLCVTRLLQMIRGANLPSAAMLVPELIVRASTAAPSRRSFPIIS
ncbi:MAG: substrate-binding domain-containing protein [Verrucomicrobiaceae bacterium]